MHWWSYTYSNLDSGRGSEGKLALAVPEAGGGHYGMKGKWYQGKPKRQWLDDIKSSRRGTTTYNWRVWRPTEVTGDVARENGHHVSPTIEQEGQSVYEWMYRLTSYNSATCVYTVYVKSERSLACIHTKFVQPCIFFAAPLLVN